MPDIYAKPFSVTPPKPLTLEEFVASLPEGLDPFEVDRLWEEVQKTQGSVAQMGEILTPPPAPTVGGVLSSFGVETANVPPSILQEGLTPPQTHIPPPKDPSYLPPLLRGMGMRLPGDGEETPPPALPDPVKWKQPARTLPEARGLDLDKPQQTIQDAAQVGMVLGARHAPPQSASPQPSLPAPPSLDPLRPLVSEAEARGVTNRLTGGQFQPLPPPKDSVLQNPLLNLALGIPAGVQAMYEAGAQLPDFARSLVEQPKATLSGLAGGVIEGMQPLSTPLNVGLTALGGVTGAKGWQGGVRRRMAALEPEIEILKRRIDDLTISGNKDLAVQLKELELTPMEKQLEGLRVQLGASHAATAGVFGGIGAKGVQDLASAETTPEKSAGTVETLTSVFALPELLAMRGRARPRTTPREIQAEVVAGQRQPEVATRPGLPEYLGSGARSGPDGFEATPAGPEFQKRVDPTFPALFSPLIDAASGGELINPPKRIVEAIDWLTSKYPRAALRVRGVEVDPQLGEQGRGGGFNVENRQLKIDPAGGLPQMAHEFAHSAQNFTPAGRQAIAEQTGWLTDMAERFGVGGMVFQPEFHKRYWELGPEVGARAAAWRLLGQKGLEEAAFAGQPPLPGAMSGLRRGARGQAKYEGEVARDQWLTALRAHRPRPPVSTPTQLPLFPGVGDPPIIYDASSLGSLLGVNSNRKIELHMGAEPKLVLGEYRIGRGQASVPAEVRPLSREVAEDLLERVWLLRRGKMKDARGRVQRVGRRGEVPSIEPDPGKQPPKLSKADQKKLLSLRSAVDRARERLEKEFPEEPPAGGPGTTRYNAFLKTLYGAEDRLMAFEEKLWPGPASNRPLPLPQTPEQVREWWDYYHNRAEGKESGYRLSAEDRKHLADLQGRFYAYAGKLKERGVDLDAAATFQRAADEIHDITEMGTKEWDPYQDPLLKQRSEVILDPELRKAATEVKDAIKRGEVKPSEGLRQQLGLDEGGFTTPELLVRAGLPAVGALTGAAISDEGDKLEGSILGATLGVGTGVGIGNILRQARQRPLPPNPKHDQLLAARAARQRQRPPLNLLDRTRMAWDDQFRPVSKAVGEMKQRGVRFRPEEDPSVVNDLVFGGASGKVQLAFSDYGKIWKAAVDSGLDRHLTRYLDLWGSLAYHRTLLDKVGGIQSHPTPKAKDLQKARKILGGIAAGEVAPFTFQEAHNGLSDLRAALPGNQWQQLEALGHEVFRLNRHALDLELAAGLIPQRAYDAMVRRGAEYVPMHRILEPVRVMHKLRGNKLSLSQQQVLFPAEGSRKPTQDPFKLSMLRHGEVLKEIERNHAAKTLIAALHKDPVMRGWVKRVSSSAQLPNQTEWGMLTFYDGGRPQKYAIPKPMAEAMNMAHMADVQLGATTLERFLQKGRGVLQPAATALNFAFSLVNPIRDIADARTLAKAHSPFNPADFTKFVGEWAIALKDVLTESPAYREFLGSGAAYSTLQKNISPETFLGVGEETIGRKLKRAVGLELVEKWNNAVEESTKVASFKRLRKGGMGQTEAAIETRRFGGSPDFARRGTKTAEANMLFMFFGPQLRGSLRTIQGLSRDPKRLAQVMVGATIGASALYGYNLSFINPDTGRKEWDHVSDSDKERYYIIFLPKLYQTSEGRRAWEYVKIPKGYADQILFNAIDRVFDTARGEESLPNALTSTASDFLPGSVPLKADDLAGTTTRRVTSMLNPLLRTPIEQALGANTFFGVPIVPSRMEKLLPNEQFTARTSPTILDFTRRLNDSAMFERLGMEWSPLRVQHAYESFLPGPGEIALSLADLAAEKQGASRPPRPLLEGTEKTAREPVSGVLARRFVGSPADQIRRDLLNRFYKALDESYRYQSTLNTVAHNRPTDLPRFLQMRGEGGKEKDAVRMAAFHRELNRYAEQLAEIGKAREAIINTTQEKPEAQRRTLNALYRAEMGILTSIEKILDKMPQMR